jgi:hypothetical protein
MLKKSLSLAVLIALCAALAQAQGLNIPNKHWGISFGNSREFTGLRFNVIERNIQRIDGVNVSAWHGGDFDRATGKIRGLGIGLPLASGTAYRSGVSIGLFGVAASKDMRGINLGGLAVGSGNDLVGVNLGGLAVGSGNDLVGINLAGLAVGSGATVKGLNAALLAVGAGEDAWGINLAGLAVGSGDDLWGLSVGGLAVGAGRDVSGISLALFAVGSGKNMTGLSVAGLAVGSGKTLKGASLAGLAVGCGKELTGISVAILAVGAPSVKGGQAALVVGGEDVKGFTLAPAYMAVKGADGRMVGLSISAFNHIRGEQRGVTIGILNFAEEISGFQLGLLNHVGSNPKGLRWLPLFNTRF